jgi:L-ascorbate metabolism protein UlaG (beta-lactamase superfamily)
MGQLTFHGHACIEIITGDGTRLLVDPFLSDNPLADVGPEHFDRLDYLLLTHGHFDHVADAWDLLRTTGALLIATFEIVSYAQEKLGLQNGHPLHIGGGYEFPFGRVKLTPALHGGQVAGEGAEGYTTLPAGILLNIDGTSIYHAGDTALIKDMELLRGQVDVALLPIGDNFTMGPDAQDPEAFRERVGPAAEVAILSAGDTYEF